MRKLNIDWELIGVIAGAIMMGFLVFYLVFSIVETEEDGQSYVGDQIIFQSDTLMVIDYSFMKANYTLSNGLVIDRELLQSLETITP